MHRCTQPEVTSTAQLPTESSAAVVAMQVAVPHPQVTWGKCGTFATNSKRNAYALRYFVRLRVVVSAVPSPRNPKPVQV